MGENNTSLSSQVWLFVRISVYKILHRHFIVLLLLDDIHMSLWKRKPAHFTTYRALKARNMPRVQENSGRVHLALSYIGWPMTIRDGAEGLGHPSKSKRRENVGEMFTKELPEVCCPPGVDGTGESPVWDRKPNHCWKLTRIQLMNLESHSQMAAQPALLASAKVNPSLLQMASSMVFAVMS